MVGWRSKKECQHPYRERREKYQEMKRKNLNLIEEKLDSEN